MFSDMHSWALLFSLLHNGIALQPPALLPGQTLSTVFLYTEDGRFGHNRCAHVPNSFLYFSAPQDASVCGEIVLQAFDIRYEALNDSMNPKYVTISPQWNEDFAKYHQNRTIEYTQVRCKSDGGATYRTCSGDQCSDCKCSNCVDNDIPQHVYKLLKEGGFSKCIQTKDHKGREVSLLIPTMHMYYPECQSGSPDEAAQTPDDTPKSMLLEKSAPTASAVSTKIQGAPFATTILKAVAAVPESADALNVVSELVDDTMLTRMHSQAKVSNGDNHLPSIAMAERHQQPRDAEREGPLLMRKRSMQKRVDVTSGASLAEH